MGMKMTLLIHTEIKKNILEKAGVCSVMEQAPF